VHVGHKISEQCKGHAQSPDDEALFLPDLYIYNRAHEEVKARSSWLLFGRLWWRMQWLVNEGADDNEGGYEAHYLENQKIS